MFQVDNLTLNLTKRQELLVIELLKYGNLKEASQQLGIKYNTARNQLASAEKRNEINCKSELLKKYEEEQENICDLKSMSGYWVSVFAFKMSTGKKGQYQMGHQTNIEKLEFCPSSALKLIGSNIAWANSRPRSFSHKLSLTMVFGNVIGLWATLEKEKRDRPTYAGTIQLTANESLTSLSGQHTMRSKTGEIHSAMWKWRKLDLDELEHPEKCSLKKFHEMKTIFDKRPMASNTLIPLKLILKD